MTKERLIQLRDIYRDGLLKDTIPWWQSRMIDKEDGGYLTYRDADGSLLSTDKAVWVLGRVIWMWSRLYNTVEKRQDWLDVASHGVDFMLKHAFDPKDGRMYFRVMKDGTPLRKRRYVFSETFGVAALSEYATATGDKKMLQKARDVYQIMMKHLYTPGLLEPKVLNRNMKGLAIPMIVIVTSQLMREHDPENASHYTAVIDNEIRQVREHFMKPEKKCVLESVFVDGKILDTPEGRTCNPGHAIEAAWFIMEEARHRGGDKALIKDACTITEWSLDIGWDKQYGGILYFVDCDGKPAEPYEHELKLWWPHNEALYGLLLAYHLTGDAKWSTWYERVHEWAYSHFPDKKNGEWFGYLRRDGTISSPIKGNMWKGPFHLPRQQLYGWLLLEEMIKKA